MEVKYWKDGTITIDFSVHGLIKNMKNRQDPL